MRQSDLSGSVPTGIAVGKAAMEQGIVRTTLELGGKNGAAFLADVSVDKMVDGIIEAGYLNQGQICAAAERFYLPASQIVCGGHALAGPGFFVAPTASALMGRTLYRAKIGDDKVLSIPVVFQATALLAACVNPSHLPK